MLKKGIKINTPDFAMVKPTYTHMVINEMVNKNIIKHIISQNCDGLHLRSCLYDRSKLSELHGNCFIEYCLNCNKEYIRLFDVTQNSKFRRHNTGRFCDTCKLELNDTIIHFGEKLKSHFPYNLDCAETAVKSADLIICIGSSLKVLKHYKWLWPNKRKQNHKLFIINNQWTPKDKLADIKINGFCDKVFEKVVFHLNKSFHLDLKCSEYDKSLDPLVKLATLLNDPIENEPSNTANTNNWYNGSFKKI